MTIDTNTVVSMTEANQSFPKVTHTADEIEDNTKAEVLASASKLMDFYDDAFKELSK